MTLVLLRNPFDLMAHESQEIAGPTRLIDLAIGAGMDPQQLPVIARIDGRIVSQKLWGLVMVSSQTIVMLQALPLGGGGGGSGRQGGKNTISTVLSIAVAVAALVSGGPIAGALGFTGVAATIATSVITAAIAIGGNLLINALIPPQGVTNDQQQPSPTYSLQARGNAARLGQPIPVIYGRHVIYPSYAASPYTTYANNEQYLYSLFVIGQGYHTIEQMRFGTADVSSFQEVQTQIIQPGDAITLFPTNVYQSSDVSGQEIRATNQYDAGTDGWLGPFAASPESPINKIGIDIAYPRGLYSITTSGSDAGTYSRIVQFVVQIRALDANGTATGDWQQLAAVDFTATSLTPLFTSYVYDVTAGRWQVRIRRVNGKATDANSGHDSVWASLKGYLVDEPSYTGIAMIAVKARATRNLSSVNARQFNAVVRRKIPLWTGSAWTEPQETTSIAWAAADVLRNTTYGGKVADSRIDLDGLLALDAKWTARGDTFNGVFDQAATVWDALSRVLRTGRARCYYQGPLIRFHRDEPQSLPVAMFSASNIVANSFSMDFVLPVDGQDVDGVEAEYIDAATWLPATLERGVSGTTPTNTAREQLTGITSSAQAGREALYQANANRYRRVFVSFRSELDGLIPSFGDPILIAHDVPRWGQSGDVEGWDAATLTLTLDQDIELVSGETSVVRLRDSHGRVSSPVTVVAQPAPDTLVLSSTPVLASGSVVSVVVTGEGEPTYWAVGSTSNTPQLAIVSSITPRGTETEILAVLEDDRVHENT